MNVYRSKVSCAVHPVVHKYQCNPFEFRGNINFADKRAFVSCTENYIHVELNKKYFNASKYASITLRNESCKAVVSNNRITLGSTPLGCGTTMINTGDEIIYKNQVILKAKVSESEMISRDRDQKITIRCAYNARGDVGGLIYPIRMREEIIGKNKAFVFCFVIYRVNILAKLFSVLLNIEQTLTRFHKLEQSQLTMNKAIKYKLFQLLRTSKYYLKEFAKITVL